MKRIPLTQGKVALVDDEDFERLNQFKWCAYQDTSTGYGTFYAYRRVGKKPIRMHRDIMSAPRGVKVDHKNGDGLDNQRDNLRLATDQQNAMNRRRLAVTSGQFKGVSWNKRDRRWYARIKINGKAKHIGCFHRAVDAARAYDSFAKNFFGEFAKLNF